MCWCFCQRDVADAFAWDVRRQEGIAWTEWDADTLRTREPDEVVAERQGHEERARQDDDARRDAALRTGTEDESGYSTEIEQGAAQPRPDTS